MSETTEETHYAVITGGIGFLGRAIASALQGPGWIVEAPGKRDLDVCDVSAVQHYFSQRSVDLLVCNAGMIRDVPLIHLTESAWNEVWAVNFTGAAACTKAVLSGMLEKRNGHIIFISSFSALHPPIGQAAYATAKAALLGLVADMASRYGHSNIRINAIMPGFLETRMTENVSEHRLREIRAMHKLGRFNTCRETAEFVRFLHHHLHHTSGQTFQLDSRTNSP